MRRSLLRTRKFGQSGMTLIELMIATVVLLVGILSVTGLLALVIGNNGRSKVDTTATMLSQAVTEQISAVLQGGGPASIQDCVGNSWTIGVDYTASAGPPGWGAAVSGNKIDFTQSSPPATSQMNFVECAKQPNGVVVKNVYDVRWNVQQMSLGDTSTEYFNGTFLVTVGARPKYGLPTQYNFALPVNMQVYVGGY